MKYTIYSVTARKQRPVWWQMVGKCSLRVFDVVDERLDCFGLVGDWHRLEVFLDERNHLGLAGVVSTGPELVNALVLLERLNVHVVQVDVLQKAKERVQSGQYYENQGNKTPSRGDRDQNQGMERRIGNCRTPAVVMAAVGAGVVEMGVSPSLLSPSYSRSRRFRVLRRARSIFAKGTDATFFSFSCGGAISPFDQFPIEMVKFYHLEYASLHFQW